MAKNAKKIKLPEVGSFVKFKGYADEVTGDDELFHEGDILVVSEAEIDKKSGDVKITAFKRDDEDGEQIDLDDQDVIDEAEKQQVYMPQEVEVYADDEDEEDSDTEEDDEDETEDAVDDEDADDTEEDDEEDVKPAKKAKASKKEKAVAKKSKQSKASDDEEDETDEDEVPAKAKKSAKAEKASKGKKAAKDKVKKAPARTEEEADEEEIHHMASVKKIIKKGDMLEAAKSLVAQAGQNYFNLGGVLAEINRTKAFTEAGYEESKEGFEEYISTELGIEYRKAMVLIKIYKRFSKLEISEDKLMQIGWTKASALAAYMPKDAETEQFEEMLEEAEEMTREDLIDHIKTSYVGADGKKRQTVKKTSYKFSAFADQAEFVNDALQSAKEKSGSDDNNEAFIFIIQEWASMSDGVDISVDDAMAVIEKRFGVKLQIVDDNADEDTDEDEAPAKAKKLKKAAKVPASKKASGGKSKGKKAA